MKYKLYKALWMIVWNVLIHPFPRASASKFEAMLLRLFGAKQMKELYEWILGKREKPEFVYD